MIAGINVGLTDRNRFEHLGDTVLGFVVTALMLEMYPGLRVGPATVGGHMSALVNSLKARKYEH